MKTSDYVHIAGIIFMLAFCAFVVCFMFETWEIGVQNGRLPTITSLFDWR